MRSLIKGLGLGLCMAAAAAMPAMAAIKSIEIEAELGSISSPGAGECFFPSYKVAEDDEVTVTGLDDVRVVSKNNPTLPATIDIRIYSDTQALDEDLWILGRGIRSTYVDYVTVDGDEAAARLEVYPLYELPAPLVTIDAAAGTASWPEVAYAKKYEVVIGYRNKSGNEKTVHKTITEKSVRIDEYLKDGNTDLGVAVRALPTTEAGYQAITANIENGFITWGNTDELSNGKANWDTSITNTQEYKIHISYKNNQGKTIKKVITTKKPGYDISAYVNSAAENSLEVKVYGVPKTNDSRYYNIAYSEWGTAGGDVNTSDYEIEDKWDFLTAYQSAVDGDFARNVKSAGAYNATNIGGIGSGAVDAYFKRVGYRLQYISGGVPYNAGWLQINNNWYYFDTDGFMHTGWLQDQGKWYYLESQIGSQTGIMITGNKKINGTEYLFDSDGTCLNKQ